MYRYVLKRLLMIVPVIIGVSLLIFVIMDLAPGDVTSVMGVEGMTEEQVANLRSELGLDRPLIERYITYMGGMLRGDLGSSYISGRGVVEMYFDRLPNTMVLAGASICVAILLSIPLGIFSAVHRGTVADNVCMVGALLGLSIPNFWLGLILIVTFSLGMGWFPSGGMSGPASVVLPAITIGTELMASMTRTTRSSMLDVIRQDYLRTARAKGVPEKKVVWSHALKNALIPIVTIIGTQLSAALGGSVLTETVFAWPGVGRLVIDSITSRDTPMVTGCIILTTITISVVLLLVDLLYAVIDPRIKAQYTKGGKVA